MNHSITTFDLKQKKKKSFKVRKKVQVCVFNIL